jgi:hypothetical protein
MQMAKTKEYLFPQGLRPGMRHTGSFQPGNDPRRLENFQPRRLPDGRTLASIARQYTEDSVNILVSVVRGELAGVKVGDQLKAAEILLDRGWGKAVSVVAMDVNDSRQMGALSRAELMVIAAGAVIDGEATDITARITATTKNTEETV